MSSDVKQRQRRRRPRREWLEVMVRLPLPVGDAFKAIAEQDSRSTAGLLRKLAADHVAQEQSKQSA
jgi:hypothetical protein